MTKPVYGLTGGIACGKSTVAAMFREHGVGIVDADQLAREIVEPGTEALTQIVATFGTDIVGDDGRLLRKKLGERVFGDKEGLAALNRITHPRIAALGMQRLMELQGTDAPYLLYEAAILIEQGMAKSFAGLIVVHVGAEVQLARLMARDGAGEADAQARIASQMPLADKVALADFTIDNSGTEAETRAAVDALHAELLRRTRSTP
ncbi:MAG: dephospho-CoA kinase [Sandaracinaceae bacterium]|nr:dephospho-CoA kinase [Myxococcales bacterium]MCB9657399.1 dephospho-CoA kinase [Sandaracinaceae bacterium]